MRRSLALALVLAMATALVGCAYLSPGSDDARSRRGPLSAILERGELRVAVSADLPPLNMKNRSGEIVGLEIDLITALAHAMGVEPRLVETPFPELLDRLERGEVDLAISGLTMTPERNVRVAFVGPYFISGTSVLTKSEQIARTQDPTTIDGPERRYAALEGSTSAQFVAEVLPRSTLVTTPDYETGVNMVLADEVDGLVADFQACMLATWKHPEAGLMAVRTPFTIEPLGIALPPDAPLLTNLVSNYLTTLKDTGLLARLKARWLSDGSWLEDLP